MRDSKSARDVLPERNRATLRKVRRPDLVTHFIRVVIDGSIRR
jgi:hypothetical protein